MWHGLLVLYPCEHYQDLSEEYKNLLGCLGFEQSGFWTYSCWYLLSVYYSVESCVNRHLTINRISVCFSPFLFSPNLSFMPEQCSVCGKESTSRCSKCKTVYYCSRECQLRDWPNHKQSCNKIKRNYTSRKVVTSCLFAIID